MAERRSVSSRQMDRIRAAAWDAYKGVTSHNGNPREYEFVVSQAQLDMIRVDLPDVKTVFDMTLVVDNTAYGYARMKRSK